MKAPNMNALNALSKAPVTDPVIAGTTSTSNTAGKAGTAGSDGQSKAKFTIRLDRDLLGRVRAAYLADLATGSGIGSLSEWAASHLEKAVKNTEARLHGDIPFTPVGVGCVPRLPLSAHEHGGAQ